MRLEERQQLAHQLAGLAVACRAVFGSRVDAALLAHRRGCARAGDLTAAAMRYRVRHETAYSYGSDVVHSHQLLHLVPRPSPFQECVDHSIRITPSDYHRRDETDAFGNIATRIELESAHRQLDVAAELEVGSARAPGGGRRGH